MTASDLLGLRLVHSLLNDPKVEVLKEHGVSEYDLFSPAKQALEWAIEYNRTTTTWPTASVVAENVGVTFATEVDPLNYIVDVIRKRTLSKSLGVELKVALDLLEGRDPDKVVTQLLETGMRLKAKTSSAKIVSYRSSADERIAAYEKLKLDGGFGGIRTRWSTLNSAIQGWDLGTFNVITARANTGKTWMSCVIANDCLEEGRRVLLVTMEMPEFRIRRRLDAVRYKIPFELLRDVTMDDLTEERWKKCLKEDETKSGDILIADKRLVQRVSDVQSLVIQYQPDIVIVDGGYRFRGRSNRSENKWAETAEVVRDIQEAAEVSRVPWVVSTQQGDSSDDGKEAKKGPKMHMWNVRYGKEWIIDPDVVIGLYANDDLRLLNQAELYILKGRERAGSHVNSFRIWWDQKAMNYSEVFADVGTEGFAAEPMGLDSTIVGF